MRLTFVVTLLLTSMAPASAATLPVTSISVLPSAEDTNAIFFPSTAQSFKVRAPLTNAELLKRGLPLAKPVKLYDSHTLARRLNAAPSGAASMPPAGTASRNYRFVSCANDVDSPDFGSHALNRDSTIQQQANQCATFSQADGPLPNTPERFIFNPQGDCYTRITSFTPIGCTYGNYGVYEIAT